MAIRKQNKRKDLPRKRWVYEKAMIRNRYNKISTSFPRHHTGKEYKQLRRHKVKRQRTSSFQAHDHQAILNNMNKKLRQTESGRTMTIRINHNSNTALERSVTIYWNAQPGSTCTLCTHPRFCCGLWKYKLFGPREGLLIHQCFKTASI